MENPPTGFNLVEWGAERARALWQVRFFRFLVVGGINTLFGYSAFAVLVLLHVHYAVAAFVSTVASILFNFKTTGTIVFRSHDNSLIVRFFAVYGINYVVSVAALKLFKAMGVHVLVTGALLILPLAALAYLLNKALVFRPDRGGPPDEGT